MHAKRVIVGFKRTSNGVCPGPAARDADVVELRPQSRHHRDTRRVVGKVLFTGAPQVRANDQRQRTAIDLRRQRQSHTQSRGQAALLVQTLRWTCLSIFLLNMQVNTAAIATQMHNHEPSADT